MFKFSNKQYFILFVLAFVVISFMVTLDAIRSGEPSAPALVALGLSLLGWVSKPKG